MPDQTPSNPIIPDSSKKPAGRREPTRHPNPAAGTWLQTVALSFIFGLLGAGVYLKVVPAAKQSAVEQNKQVTLQENSATIDLVKHVGPAVVSITTSSSVQSFFGDTQQQQGAGTGVIVTSDGLVLTNKHVVEGADTVTVTTTDGKEFKGKVVAKDPSNDIAFVRVEATGLQAAELGDSDKVEVGQRVVAIGNALGEFSNSVTTGVISGKGRPIQASNGQGGAESLSNLFQTDAAINPGNSGGPLVNIEGQVIGINTAVAGQGSQNIGFTIPINEVKSALDSVKEKGSIVRPYLGVRYVMITEAFAKRNNLPIKEGALLRGDTDTLAIVPNSPGAKGGLREGDIITKLGDTSVNANTPLQSALGKFKVGDTIKVTVYRDGKEQSVQVKLEEAPASQN